MKFLNRALDITAASDNSDGILGSLWNISEKSKCAFMLNLDNIVLPQYILEFAAKNEINPWNLFFFWGDWQVIITLNPTSLKKFKDHLNILKVEYYTITFD